MSGSNAFTHATPTSCKAYGPTRRSRFDLMGIRFLLPAGDESGGGGGGTPPEPKPEEKPEPKPEEKPFNAPKDQAELDRIVGERLARERDKYKDYDELKKDKAELEKLREEKLTADEKALKAARDEGKAEVQAELATERVRFALEKALTGRVPDAGALLDLDRSQFVKDGKADTDAIKVWVDANSKEATKGNTPDPSQRGGGGASGNEGSLEAGQSAYEKRHPPKKQ